MSSSSLPTKISSDSFLPHQWTSLQKLLQEREEYFDSVKRELEFKVKNFEIKTHEFKTKTQELEVKNNELTLENIRLNEILKILQKKYFGSKSEKIPAEQLNLFNEAEHLVAQEDSQAQESQEASELAVKGYKRSRGKRQPLPEHLPREEIVIKLEGKDRLCPEGHELKEIGEDASEQLDMVPAKLKVIRTIRKKYACSTCEEHVKTAPLPPAPIPKSMATPGLLSHILINKYTDALPLYRQEAIFKRHQIEISRTTMARWMIRVGEVLRPLWNLMEEELLDSDYLNCDETRVQVLREPGREASSQSYMWVRYRAGPNKIILYDYSPNRSAEVASRLLSEFKGYLQVDGYGSYNAVASQEGVVRVGCWAHVRRKFYEAYEASKKGQGLAYEMLQKIQGLYAIEKICRDQSSQDRHELRQSKSKPLLQGIEQWLNKYQDAAPPKSKLGQAMTYLKNEWPHLTHYLEDGRISIDNNPVENAIRPFALGRKNWLFSDSVSGAESSAVIYSLVETAKANGLDLYDYFRYVLEQLPQCKDLDSIEALLPYRIKANRHEQSNAPDSKR